MVTRACAPVVAGVDLGGTKILGRVIDPADPTRAVATTRVDTPVGDDAIVDAITEVVHALDHAAQEHGATTAVGVGAAGLVDRAGVLRFSPNLPTLAELDLVTVLKDRLGRAVVVDNDANCAAVAEHRLGAAHGTRDAVMVALGTGIGAGIIAGGELQRGAAGFAGEPGHMIVDPNGPPCPCGRRGCWERMASGSGLGRLARDAAEAGMAGRVVALAGGDVHDVRGEHVTQAALEGDEEACALLRQLAWWVALGITNLVSVLDCELVVIGGGLVAAGEALLGPTRDACRSLMFAGDHRPPVRIEIAALGSEAGAIGAALLAADLAPSLGAR
jgi:glucokinase